MKKILLALLPVWTIIMTSILELGYIMYKDAWWFWWLIIVILWYGMIPAWIISIISILIIRYWEKYLWLYIIFLHIILTISWFIRFWPWDIDYIKTVLPYLLISLEYVIFALFYFTRKWSSTFLAQLYMYTYSAHVALWVTLWYLFGPTYRFDDMPSTILNELLWIWSIIISILYLKDIIQSPSKPSSN